MQRHKHSRAMLPSNMRMGKSLVALATVVLSVACHAHQAQAAAAQATAASASALSSGAYLGCFSLQTLLQRDRSLTRQVPQQFAGSLSRCMTYCKSQQHILSIVTSDLKCRCAAAVPDVDAQLADSACSASGTGAAVFYHHDAAATESCNLAPIPMSSDSMNFDYNADNALFFKDRMLGQDVMRLRMQGKEGIRVAPIDSWQMHGAVEVMAMVDGARGAVSAFYLRSNDVYTLDNKNDFDELDFEFVNGKPAIKNCVWLNTFNGGVSGGEHVIKPAEYQATLGLTSRQTTQNTYMKYTLHWQPSRVTWAINGVPVLTKIAGQHEGIFSPDAKAHLAFSMWTDSRKFHFGGELDLTQSPYYSYFHSLKRIVCDGPSAKPLPSALSWLNTNLLAKSPAAAAVPKPLSTKPAIAAKPTVTKPAAAAVTQQGVVKKPAFPAVSRPTVKQPTATNGGTSKVKGNKPATQQPVVPKIKVPAQAPVSAPARAPVSSRWSPSTDTAAFRLP